MRRIVTGRWVGRLVLALFTLGVGVGLSASPASAKPLDSSCPSGYCVWSGDNYTGTKIELTIPGLGQCFAPTASGFDAARSANVTGDAFYLVFYDNSDCTGSGATVMYRSIPAFDTPKRGIVAGLIRI